MILVNKKLYNEQPDIGKLSKSPLQNENIVKNINLQKQTCFVLIPYL